MATQVLGSIFGAGQPPARRRHRQHISPVVAELANANEDRSQTETDEAKRIEKEIELRRLAEDVAEAQVQVPAEIGDPSTLAPKAKAPEENPREEHPAPNTQA